MLGDVASAEAGDASAMAADAMATAAARTCRRYQLGWRAMAAPSLVGRMLGGRYLLGDLLGEGGWGAVYAATQTDLGRPVAIKVLRNEALGEPDLLARFEREAKAAASLGHPNIALVTEL